MHAGSLPNVLVGHNTNEEPDGDMWGILNKVCICHSGLRPGGYELGCFMLVGAANLPLLMSLSISFYLEYRKSWGLGAC